MDEIESKDTLYCFKFDTITGRVSEFAITDYRVKRHAYTSSRDEFRFVSNLGLKSQYGYSVRRDNLDKFVHDKVFTFNPDVKHAREVMISKMKSKLSQAKLEVERQESLLKKIRCNDT